MFACDCDCFCCGFNYCGCFLAQVGYAVPLVRVVLLVIVYLCVGTGFGLTGLMVGFVGCCLL